MIDLDLWKTIALFHEDTHFLLDAKTDEEFLNWIKILYKRDRRSLYLYLKKNASKIPENRLVLVSNLFPKPIV